jgi:hypothetical protein
MVAGPPDAGECNAGFSQSCFPATPPRVEMLCTNANEIYEQYEVRGEPGAFQLHFYTKDTNDTKQTNVAYFEVCAASLM